MDYTQMDIEAQLALIGEVNAGYPQKITAAARMWTDLHGRLTEFETSLQSKHQDLSPQWQDAAGELLGTRVDASLRSLTEWTSKISAEPSASLRQLAESIPLTAQYVQEVYDWYLSMLHAAVDEAALKEKANRLAGEQMNQLGAQFAQTANLVRNSVGGAWDGPRSEGGGPSATGAPPEGMPDSPGAAPATDAAAPDAGDMPAGGDPAAGGPSLAGMGNIPAPVAPPVPPGGIPAPQPALPPMPSPVGAIPPPITPRIPSLQPRIPSVTGGATPSPRLAGVQGMGSVSAGRSGVPPIPKVSSLGVAAMPASVPEAPVAPTMLSGGNGASSTATAGRSGAVAPMAPPMSGAGGAGAGGRPQPGKGQGPVVGKGKQRKGTPGVPTKLRGSAADQASPAMSSQSRRRRTDDESTTVELLDEELWRVDDNHAAPVTQPEKSPTRSRSRPGR